MLLKPAAPAKISRWPSSAVAMGYEKLSPGVVDPAGTICTSTSSCGFLTGSQRSIKASIRLKIAVLAPMPSASVSTITNVKPGLPRKTRKA
jgi:hypothetical protein